MYNIIYTCDACTLGYVLVSIATESTDTFHAYYAYYARMHTMDTSYALFAYRETSLSETRARAAIREEGGRWGIFSLLLLLERGCLLFIYFTFATRRHLQDLNYQLGIKQYLYMMHFPSPRGPGILRSDSRDSSPPPSEASWARHILSRVL